jgi:hypothetical protein
MKRKLAYKDTEKQNCGSYKDFYFYCEYFEGTGKENKSLCILKRYKTLANNKKTLSHEYSF